MAEIDTQTMQLDGHQLFTCLSCTIAFLTAEEQRVHYRSDHHRYNMKRRVANLPPVSAAVFNQKVLERRQETAVMLSPKGSTCDICNKSYTTENAFRSHMNSKKHKENELRALSRPKLINEPEPETALEAEPAGAEAEPVASTSAVDSAPEHAGAPSVPSQHGVSLQVDAEATEEEINMTLDEKIAAARSRLSPAHCLFCTIISSSLADNLTHMSSAHSFFIPDAEYLVDLQGLISYLGEKIAVGNVCLCCNGRGREFRTIEAVRKHMVDKSHCKVAYETEADMLEVVDYYDFSASYPDAEERAARKAERRAAREEARRVKEERRQAKEQADEEWEADDGEGEADEIVDEEASAPEDSDAASDDEDDDNSSDEDSLPDSQIKYGDSSYELVLPNGRRLIHRDMQRYVKQRVSLAPSRGGRADDPNSGAALVRRLLADKNAALVPRKGGFGAYGQGTDVVKARNAGEAREAGRHVREFRDQRRREQFKTMVGFKNNSQKHFRDPLLQ